MFAIRCLTTGDYIYIDEESFRKLAYHSGKIPGEVKNEMMLPNGLFVSETSKEVLKFKTAESAQWFANRRLTYNAKRKDWSKLSLMESIFKCNNLPDITVKVEFEVVEI